jgi:hypothetical protein
MHCPPPLADGVFFCCFTPLERLSCKTMDEDLILIKKLESLRDKHRDLDQAITRMMHENAGDALGMGRLKKQKLALRDEISQLEKMVYPDIIA